MKTFAIASIIALASVASAQLDNIPSCALSCFIGPLGQDGCAALTDFKCHCQKGSELLSKVEPCVKSGCSAADQAATIEAVQKTCKDAGAPIEIPNAGAVSSAVASAASSAVASATSAAGSVISSKAAEASSVAGAISSVVASATSAAASKASSGVAGATSALLPSGPSSAPSQFTGAAAPMATQAAGLLGAAALAMLAL